MITPTQDYRRASCQSPRKLYKGLDAAVNTVIGRVKRGNSVFSEIEKQAEEVEAQADEWKAMNDHELRSKIFAFRQIFRRGGRDVEENVAPALAAVREAAQRTLGLRPFMVQIMGALALYKGYLAEMATGEGKTLTAGIAAVLAGWTRRPTHVITVNDYLVKRDPKWLKMLYEFCGVRVGWVTGDMQVPERQKGYNCDVTYSTSKEILADFLRDRLRIGTVNSPVRRLIKQMGKPEFRAREQLVMRGVDIAIIDEADSVLIDEAVTPLIISAPKENKSLEHVVMIACRLVNELEAEIHYKVVSKYREVELTPEGRRRIEEICSDLPGFWHSEERRLELLRQALVAREFYVKGKQYVIVDDKVVIVDEFTGRPMPQRSWRQGMHQAIEAKEGLPISSPAETIARLSFQRFFRLYRRLSGMTGTAAEASPEFWQIYGLAVVKIPTNKPCIREQWPDRYFPDDEAKWQGIVGEIKRVYAKGRPILVGTRSVTASEKLSKLLDEAGLIHRLLNAVHHQEEAGIIADAGERGRITIATNMAGRGTDILLGKGVKDLGGLHVISTEKHESGRVDRQLYGRAGRQGDPGSAQAFVSADDELVKRHLRKTLQKSLNMASATPVPGRSLILARFYHRAQANAQRMAYKQRKSVLKMDNWLEDALGFASNQEV